MVEQGVIGPVREAVEAVFVGTFTHSLDPKRRFTIPSEWRDQMKGETSLYVLPDVEEKCLCVMTVPEMSRRLASAGHHSIVDQQARQFARTLASRSDLVAWDTQGRIRIKDPLLEFARVKDRVVMVGGFRFFEIWSEETMKKVGRIDDAGYRDAARHVGF